MESPQLPKPPTEQKEPDFMFSGSDLSSIIDKRIKEKEAEVSCDTEIWWIRELREEAKDGQVVFGGKIYSSIKEVLC